MNFTEYETLLRKRLGTYFDFKTDVSLDDRDYPLVAEHTARADIRKRRVLLEEKSVTHRKGPFPKRGRAFFLLGFASFSITGC